MHPDSLLYAEALPYISQLIKIDPSNPEYYKERAYIFYVLSKVHSAILDLHQAEKVFDKSKHPDSLLYKILEYQSSFNVFLFNFEIAEQYAERFIKIAPNHPMPYTLLAGIYHVEGELDKTLKMVLKAKKMVVEYPEILDKESELEVKTFVEWTLGLIYLEKGSQQKAIDHFQKSSVEFTGVHRDTFESLSCWSLVHPQYSKMDLAGAFRFLSQQTVKNAMGARSCYVYGVMYYLQRDYNSSYIYFSQGPGCWGYLPGATFYHARAAAALGYKERARELFVIALRVRPKLVDRFQFNEEERELLVAARNDLEELVKQQNTDKVQIKDLEQTLTKQRKILEEQKTKNFAFSQMKTLEKLYRFSEAAKDYKNYAQQIETETIRQEALYLSTRSEKMDRVVNRLREAITKKKIHKDLIQIGNEQGRIVKITKKHLELQLKKGSATVPWGFLSLKDFYYLVSQLTLSPEEMVALGSYCINNGLEENGWESLAYASKYNSTKKDIDQVISRYKKTPIPKGGFVFYRGKFITPKEKKYLEQGLVFFREKWVTKQEKEYTLKGYQKVNDKWILLTEEQLLAKGWEKIDGEWLSLSELAKKRNLWGNAKQKITPHFVLKSDRGESFLEELALALESAYSEWVPFFKGPQIEKKMIVLAFKNFDDYRDYCQKLGKVQVLAALGFAPSENYTCCGYDKFDDTQIFIETLVHEGTHLYYWVAFQKNLPSWLSEGMATYFEGFRKSQGKYEYHLMAEKRLTFFRPILDQKSLDLDFLTGSDAEKLINADTNKALAFYSQNWALFYFMVHSVDPKIKAIYEQLMAKAKKGEPLQLATIIGKENFSFFEKSFFDFYSNF